MMKMLANNTLERSHNILRLLSIWFRYFLLMLETVGSYKISEIEYIFTEAAKNLKKILWPKLHLKCFNEISTELVQVSYPVPENLSQMLFTNFLQNLQTVSLPCSWNGGWIRWRWGRLCHYMINSHWQYEIICCYL